MSEQDDKGQHPAPTDYQQAAAARGEAVPYGQAAAQAVGQVQDPDTAAAADAGQTIEQIRQQVTREVLLPMESKIEDMMAAARRQQDEMARQIQQLQAQLQSTQAQVGPPAFQLYAASLAQRVRSLQAAHPAVDLSEAVKNADKLAAAAADVAAGEAEPGVLAKLAGPIERHFTLRVPHLEGAATVVAELGHLADEADKIAA